MAALVGQLSSVGGGTSLLGGSKTSGDLYVGILKSRSIASAMVDRFHLLSVYKVKKESQAEKILASHTDFTVGAKDTIVTISVTEKDAVLSRDMANAYLDALRSTSGGLALTENSQKRKFFEQRLALEKDELANAEVALKQTQEKSGFVAPAGQMATEIGALAELRAQIAGREVRLASLRQYESDDNQMSCVSKVKYPVSAVLNVGGSDVAIFQGLALWFVEVWRSWSRFWRACAGYALVLRTSGAARIGRWITRWRILGFRRFPCFSCKVSPFCLTNGGWSKVMAARIAIRFSA